MARNSAPDIHMHMVAPPSSRVDLLGQIAKSADKIEEQSEPLLGCNTRVYHPAKAAARLDAWIRPLGGRMKAESFITRVFSCSRSRCVIDQDAWDKDFPWHFLRNTTAAVSSSRSES